VPSPDSTGSRATCPSPNRWLRLNRGIAICDFNVHVTLALAKPDVPIYDSGQTPLCACRLTPSQLLSDLTGCRVSEIYSTTLSRRSSSSWGVLRLATFDCATKTKGTNPPELKLPLIPSEILSSPLLALGLQQFSTALRSPRSCALTATANPTFPFSDLPLRLHVRPTLHLHDSNNHIHSGLREQKLNCLASSTHSMRRNSTALYAGVSWLKQRNN
jgi:hypothetical protein